jgi:hypothetical protein
LPFEDLEVSERAVADGYTHTGTLESSPFGESNGVFLLAIVLAVEKAAGEKPTEEKQSRFLATLGMTKRLWSTA